MKKVTFLCLNSISATNGPVLIHKIEISHIRDFINSNISPLFVFKEVNVHQYNTEEVNFNQFAHTTSWLNRFKLIAFEKLSESEYLRIIIFFYKLYRLKKNVDIFFSKRIASDVIICDSEFECYFVLKRRNSQTKVVMYQHNDGFPCKMTFNQYPECSQFLWFLFRRRLSFTLKNVDGIVFLSQKFKNNFSCQYTSIEYKKLAVISNGIPDKFEMKKTPREKIKIICSGTLTKRKGQKIIVDALLNLGAKYYEKFEILFFGDGPELNFIRDTICHNDLSTTIKLMGKSSNKNIINEMLNSHIVILMSEDEGMPLSIIEGMMTGCAIISTDVGCIRDMITEECGYIIERDSQTLAMILSSLEISTIKEMGLRSRERYLDNYSSNMMIKNQISYLNSL